MTRRERLESKLEKRTLWADKAEHRASQRFDNARAATAGIEFGQPILVGHHSEKRHRAAIARMESSMRKGCEEQKLAEHHEQKAHGLENQLDRSIYSDDDNAIEALEARIAEREAERARIKAYNASCRKGKRDVNLLDAKQQADLVSIARVCAYQLGKNGEMPAYVAANLSGNIRQDRLRIATIKRRACRVAEAEQAGGISIVYGSDGFCRVTFAEKPSREVLSALKSSNYFWSAGSWHGMVATLPACVTQLVSNP